MDNPLMDAESVADFKSEDAQTLSDRSMSPEAVMNLLLRFETPSGPRTVIACSVPRHVAAEIADVMKKAGQHAEFVDRCSPLSIADRLMISSLH
jgi:hypothetical protein